MELSFIIAKVFSIIYISSGIAVLIGTININAIVKELDSSPALTFISGAIGIILGTILITYHNKWVLNWRVLITIIGWMLLIGGLIVVIIPKSLSYLNNSYTSSRYWGIFMIVIGVVIGYFGFIK